MTKKNKKKKENRKVIVKFIISLLLIVSLSYIIFNTNILKPKVNELTTSYISSYNKDITDELNIDNISKMSNGIGKSIFNYSSIVVDVNVDKDSNYDVLVYPIINDIDYKYIHIYVDGKDYYLSDLDNDGEGKIIYSGKNDMKLKVKMWVDSSYSGDISNNSFSIKVKSR